MTKGKRNVNKKRESILDAATQAFSNEGYDIASMDLIAEMAGASKRTVYNHFESKEVLFRAVFEKSMERMGLLEKISYDKTKSLEDQLSQFIDARLGLRQNPCWVSLTKVVFSVFIKEPELAQEAIAKDHSDDALLGWLRDAEADGRISLENPELSVNVFRAMEKGAFLFPMLFSIPMVPEDTEILKKEIVSTFLSRCQVTDKV